MPSSLFVIAALSAAIGSMTPVVDVQVPTRDVAIVDAAVIDVAAGRALPGQTIIVRGPRIVAMGPRATTTVPRGALVVDGAGRFLMPGLWDMHGHVFPRATRTPDEHAWQLPLYLATGVTGVRDLWTNLEDLAQVRAWNDAAMAGRLIAPRLVPTGPMVDGPTGIFRHEAIVVAGEADARHAVDSIANGGAHAVKMHNGIPREAFFAIAARSKERGLPLIGHVPSRPGPSVRLTRDSTLLAWRAIAKDGMTLAADQATLRPATQQIANGESYDFELVPMLPGKLLLTITSNRGDTLLSTSASVR